jgi:predicted aldo/keto reductase-like oxidoreductase
VNEGAKLIRLGIDLGINFIDTALSYGTHPHVAQAIKGLGRSQLVISTKTNAKTLATAEADIQQVLGDLGTDYVDCFLMHGVRTEADFIAREPILDALCKAKAKGITKFVGASTHIYSGALPRLIEDARIEVILAVGSRDMLGVRGATPFEQRVLLAKAAAKGKAVCLMKVLGEGRHAPQAEEYIRAALDIPGAHSITIGMINEAQVRMAVQVATGQIVPEEIRLAALKGAEVRWAQSYPDHYE